MNRNELKTIAEGFKSVRPPRTVQGFNIATGPSGGHMEHIPMQEMPNPAYTQWHDDVRSIAAALKLEENPKALSNFYAACGWIHGS